MKDKKHLISVSVSRIFCVRNLMFSEDLPLWEEMYVKKIIPHLPFTENLLLAHNETILR